MVSIKKTAIQNAMAVLIMLFKYKRFYQVTVTVFEQVVVDPASHTW
jgi:hypothetical protein